MYAHYIQLHVLRGLTTTLLSKRSLEAWRKGIHTNYSRCYINNPCTYHREEGYEVEDNHLTSKEEADKIKKKVVAYHGSYWWEDWKNDGKCNQVAASDFYGDDNSGFVHNGFLQLTTDSYEGMNGHIRVFLGREPNRADNVFFIGHSLGGALAMLNGLKLSNDHRL